MTSEEELCFVISVSRVPSVHELAIENVLLPHLLIDWHSVTLSNNTQLKLTNLPLISV
jgi:hypothetical protein